MTSTGTTAVENDVRDRIAVALDVPDLVQAVGLMRQVAPWVGVAKVGLELYSAAGPGAIEQLRTLDVDVFVDLKLHDIPTTVERAARVLGGHGVAYLNFHAAGGIDMLRAGVAGLADGAARAGHPSPRALAVTVLTSDSDTSAFASRLQLAIDAECAGVVCSMHEVAAAHRARADLVTVVPGIRLAGGTHHDQRRVGTPEAAIAAGADVIVVGRAITEADDPVRAARDVHAAVARGARG
jgi:orotidine-5'-phosphate decarboxylase